MDYTKKSSVLIGIHPLKEALESQKQIDKVFLKKGMRTELISELKAELRKRDIYYVEVPEEKLRKYTHKPHQGVIAFVAPVTFYNLGHTIADVYENGRSPFFLILDRVSDVRNFGAILRSAEFFGVDAVIIPFKGASAVNYDSIKTSAGAVFNVRICKEGDLKNTVNFLKQNGITVASITEKASKSITGPSLKKPLALILGNEETGIDKDLIKLSDISLKINGYGKTGSLNVSVAAGIALQQFADNE